MPPKHAAEAASHWGTANLVSRRLLTLPRGGRPKQDPTGVLVRDKAVSTQNLDDRRLQEAFPQVRPPLYCVQRLNKAPKSGDAEEACNHLLILKKLLAASRV